MEGPLDPTEYTEQTLDADSQVGCFVRLFSCLVGKMFDLGIMWTRQHQFNQLHPAIYGNMLSLSFCLLVFSSSPESSDVPNNSWPSYNVHMKIGCKSSLFKSILIVTNLLENTTINH